MLETSVAKLVSSKKAVIFDLFHTLTSTETASKFAQPTADTLGIDRAVWNDHLVNKSKPRLIGLEKDPYKIIKSVADKIKPGIDSKLLKLATENRLKRFQDSLLNIPDETLATLSKLKLAGKKIALCSNADVIESEHWKLSPMAQFFDVVIFSCDVGYIKPEKEIFEITLEKLNEKPENCVFIGDGGSNELAAAKEIGFTSIMITGIIKNLWPHKIDKIKKDADFVIENINELLEK